MIKSWSSNHLSPKMIGRDDRNHQSLNLPSYKIIFLSKFHYFSDMNTAILAQYIYLQKLISIRVFGFFAISALIRHFLFLSFIIFIVSYLYYFLLLSFPSSIISYFRKVTIKFGNRKWIILIKPGLWELKKLTGPLYSQSYSYLLQ